MVWLTRALTIILTYGDVTMKISLLQHLPVCQSQGVRIQNSAMSRVPGIIRGEFGHERVGVQLYGSVINDNGLYKMWYSPIPSVKSIRNTFLVAYAESHDGISWQKPVLNICDFESSFKNNLTNLSMHNPNVILNPQPDLYPYRFLAIGFIHPPYLAGGSFPKSCCHALESGYHVAGSNDGAHWEIISRHKISPVVSDVGNFHYDRRNEKYWIAAKEIDFSFNCRKRRSIGIAASANVLDFPQSSIIITPDEIADRQANAYGYEQTEFYGMRLWSDESVLFGLMWQLYTGAPFADKNPYGMWGPGDVRLFYCSDAGPWQRAGTEPTLACDDQERWLATGNLLDKQDSDELLLYYSASNHGHAWFVDRHMQFRGDLQEKETWDTIRIGVSRIEKDRLAGAYAETGALDIMLPDGFGRSLTLNADEVGNIRKEVRTPDDHHVMPGYSAESFVTIAASSCVRSGYCSFSRIFLAVALTYEQCRIPCSVYPIASMHLAAHFISV